MARLIKKTKAQVGLNQAAAAGAAKVVAKTEVRNTAIPKTSIPAKMAGTATATAPKPSISHDQIARRAYEIWASGQGGSAFDNWVRAERELRGR
jgi:hypothetical protein